MCVKFVFGMGSGLKPIFKKLFVCYVRFGDSVRAVLVDVVPTYNFKIIFVCEVCFRDFGSSLLSSSFWAAHRVLKDISVCEVRF